MTYKVFIGSGPHGILKTVLVEEETYNAEEKNPAFFFPVDFIDIKDHGTVEIIGPAEHMVPDTLQDM